jgi:hypothetical protein
MELDDLLEFSAESLLKEFMRKELVREGIDIDNWQRKSASVLCGSLGTIVGGLLGGPLGFLLGTMLWGVGQSAQYSNDRSPEEVKNKYREAARIKAVERCVQIIADQAPAELHPKFREAFYEAQRRYSENYRAMNSYEFKSAVGGILSSVDYSTAIKFDRLYSAAVKVIG